MREGWRQDKVRLQQPGIGSSAAKSRWTSAVSGGNVGFQGLEPDSEFEFHLGIPFRGCEHARRTGFRNALALRKCCRVSLGLVPAGSGMGMAPEQATPSPAQPQGRQSPALGRLVMAAPAPHCRQIPNLPLCKLSASRQISIVVPGDQRLSKAPRPCPAAVGWGGGDTAPGTLHPASGGTAATTSPLQPPQPRRAAELLLHRG